MPWFLSLFHCQKTYRCTFLDLSFPRTFNGTIGDRHSQVDHGDRTDHRRFVPFQGWLRYAVTPLQASNPTPSERKSGAGTCLRTASRGPENPIFWTLFVLCLTKNHDDEVMLVHEYVSVLCSSADLLTQDHFLIPNQVS